MKMRTAIRVSFILLATLTALASVAAGADYKVVTDMETGRRWRMGLFDRGQRWASLVHCASHAGDGD